MAVSWSRNGNPIITTTAYGVAEDLLGHAEKIGRIFTKNDNTFSHAATAVLLRIRCAKHRHASNAAAKTILPTHTRSTLLYAASTVGRNMPLITSTATAGDAY